MSLKLMYITNSPDVARIAEEAGVNRIFVDMEYIGKSERQGGMDTVQSNHTLEDIKEISSALSKAELLVRVNPIHEKTNLYSSSEEEIKCAIENGADILMLPYFKTVYEVEHFISCVGGKAKTMLLLETPEAVSHIDDILAIPGVDEMYIGLNDLSLGYGLNFMFELLENGLVEKLSYKFREKGIPFGFGGIASLGKGMLPAEYIIAEHYRLGSTCAILSRSFCNTNNAKSIDEIRRIFCDGVKSIRIYEEEVSEHSNFFLNNLQEIKERVNLIVKNVQEAKK